MVVDDSMSVFVIDATTVEVRVIVIVAVMLDVADAVNHFVVDGVIVTCFEPSAIGSMQGSVR